MQSLEIENQIQLADILKKVIQTLNENVDEIE